jgi:hypothetical protein
MKTFSMLLLLLVTCLCRGQVSTNAPHLATVPEAVNIASGLRVGMRQRDVLKFLEHRGITYESTNIYSASVGSAVGWTTSLPLAGGCNLGLDMRPRKFGETPWGADGLLEGAFIESNHVHIISITFTNRP